MYNIIKESNDYLDVKMAGKVEGEEYANLLAKIEEKLKTVDSIDLLVDASELDKMTFSAVWEELKFDIKNFRVIRKFAIVGDSTSQKILATISEPFVKEKAKFFKKSEIELARKWVH